MRSISRKIAGAAVVLGACAFSLPAEGQGMPRKAKAGHSTLKKAKLTKADAAALEAARRAHVKLHALCEDGVWAIHVSNPCIRHEGKVASQNRAAMKARDRAILNEARRARGIVSTVSESGAH